MRGAYLCLIFFLVGFVFCLEAAAGHCSEELVQRDVVTDGLVCHMMIIFDVLPRIFGLVVKDYINGFYVL